MSAIAAKNTITNIVVFTDSLMCEEFDAITLKFRRLQISFTGNTEF